MTSEYYGARVNFFTTIFGEYEGYVCLASLSASMKEYKESFFEWPHQATMLLAHVDRLGSGRNVYFCPQILDAPARKKEHISFTPVAWADLDTCPPDKLLVPPTLLVETSEGRHQGLWKLEDGVEPSEAERISRNIAYYHKDDGCDVSGWDLTQLLRVPATVNHKYSASTYVKVVDGRGLQYNLEDFRAYPNVGDILTGEIPFPTEMPEEDAKSILHRFRLQLNAASMDLFDKEPEPQKWSQALWSLMMQCLEAGMTREQVFIVCEAAACNKFKRDGRDPKYLWKDIVRAYFKHEENVQVARIDPKADSPILSQEERSYVESLEPGWVERYIKWARDLGDAAHQYHQASAFVALSACLSGAVRLPTSFGTVIPNLWFMILADTTLTRKTTSMDIGMSVVEEITDDFLLATDGSIEGLFGSLSTRPGQPSIFLRDEFTGLLEQMTKRDYMAGFAEMLTKLYDGKVQKRVLRKETLTVKDPILIVYAGGIRSRMQLLMTTEQIASGFLPRFVFISAESDINRVKPLGPPTVKNMDERDKIVEELRDIYTHYNVNEAIQVGEKILRTGRPKIFQAQLSDDAWARFNVLEAAMNAAGMATEDPDIYTPLYDRLGKSILKAAVLMATARQRPEGGTVRVEVDDILRAIYYGEGWRKYAKDIVRDVGITNDERRLTRIMTSIIRRGNMTRSHLMQAHHMTARETDFILATLEQRGLITRSRLGRGEMIVPVQTATKENVP